MNPVRKALIKVAEVGYEQYAKRYIFRHDAQQSHTMMIDWLEDIEDKAFWLQMSTLAHSMLYSKKPTSVGGVTLDYPLMLAAGFVKGHGFADEAQARQAVQAGVNIIPGWHIVPRLVGLVEFGSFTRYPRIGNTGTVMWRDMRHQSTQNRVGLRNPGAVAAALFLGQHKDQLPSQFGINIAPTPGLDDERESIQQVIQAMAAFIKQGVVPTWFTLNLSCPNTEDDPTGNQTESSARHMVGAVMQFLTQNQINVPLWVKISPQLAPTQYATLMGVFNNLGVKAVIATNTLGRPAPDNPELTAGLGGGLLHSEATRAITHLQTAKLEHGYNVDIVGCGGLLNGDSYRSFTNLGVSAMQYWSALIFRGPFAGAIIESERKQ
ncbi:hypothetical protein G4Y79_17040 [Phototrophicus methaneseepsis]|uniref:Dihydroorotate dehydrogenase catalytic domain-containing protein n=1 Tax=Phototrophicus methaneseepsis TaxID=2710758 RepID=A0A7S8E6Q9_9CHLR|nr:hypothetical protein [Phototrophicus methaneseepsis]QPC81393.1 hypothetical protein G4Y79_17040 [Phototrophicus methaneseepsis]